MLTLDPSKVPGYVTSVIITWSINYNYNYYKLCSPSIYPSKVPDHLQVKIKMPNPSQEPPASSKAPNSSQDREPKSITLMYQRPKTSDHIKIKIKMLNLSQKPSASSKALNEDLKDMNALCTLKIKMES